MLRILNVIACAALLGSAVYAYSIKYETMYHAEQIAKMKRQIASEHDAMASLQAEWGYLTRPERIQELSDKYLDLEEGKPHQIIAFKNLPDRAVQPSGDAIGHKLEALGLSEPTNTPGGDTVSTSTPASGMR